MRFLAVVLIGCFGGSACKADAPTPAPTPAPSGTPVRPLDVAPLPGAPTPASIAGWWIVDARFVPPMDEPTMKPGSAYLFASDAMQLVFGDATDKRKIVSTTATGDALRLGIEGADLLITRRNGGIAVQQADDSTKIPLRRATPEEVARIEAAEKKRGKMLDRACEKAMECCMAARAKGVAKELDCQPLTGPPDLSMCIAAIQVFKNKAATGKVVIPECLPDK